MTRYLTSAVMLCFVSLSIATSALAVEPEQLVRLRRTGSNLCANGQIVSDQYVVFPAHCVHNMIVQQLTVQPQNAGMQAQIVSVVQTRMHPQYSSQNQQDFGLDYDVAVVRLAQPLIFSQYVQPMPTLSDLSANFTPYTTWIESETQPVDPEPVICP